MKDAKAVPVLMLPDEDEDLSEQSDAAGLA
jgi:polyphosphate kinase